MAGRRFGKSELSQIEIILNALQGKQVFYVTPTYNLARVFFDQLAKAVPFEDKKAVKNVAQFIRKYKPDDVLCVGDEIDFQTISRWSSGRDEWSGTIGRDRDRTVEVLSELQVQHLSRSNHSARLYNSLSKRLPGLIGLPELTIERFLRLDELGIKYHHKPYQFHEDWVKLCDHRLALR